MADENNLSSEQNEFMKKLKAIGTDLWGSGADIWHPDDGAEDAEQKPEPSRLPLKKKRTGGIDNIWKTADETIDWTDALAHSTPTDGLTGPRMWAFYHKNAQKVLDGDLNTYTEVLQKANPLGELTEFAENITMRAPAPERLESTFICKKEQLDKNRKLYLME